MSRERENDPFGKVTKGIKKQLLQAGTVFGTSVTLDATVFERVIEGGSEQALGFFMIATLLSGASLYDFYQEGEEKEAKQK